MKNDGNASLFSGDSCVIVKGRNRRELAARRPYMSFRSAVTHEFSLSALKLGKQYTALTKRACQKIKILNEEELSEDDRDQLKRKSERNRLKGIAMADEICRKYRREGQFFDEILKAGE